MVSGSVLEMGRAGAEEFVMSKPEYYQRNAVCPFFRSANHERIHCSGIIPGTSMRSRFQNVPACNYHFRHYCARIDNYVYCPVYQAIEKK